MPESIAPAPAVASHGSSSSSSVAGTGSGSRYGSSPGALTRQAADLAEATTFLRAAVTAVTDDTVLAVAHMWEVEKAFTDKLYLPTAILLVGGMGIVIAASVAQAVRNPYNSVEFVSILVVGFLMMIAGSAMRFYQYRSERVLAEGIQKAAEKSVASASRFVVDRGSLTIKQESSQ